MFDNFCKFLAETFPEDYATWLLGSPIKLTQLSPTELSSEPIRADSLILEQSENLVLHLEFQTEADERMGFRMLDYRVRVHRRFPTKTMHQVVIYLKKSNSPLVYEDSFYLEKTHHSYCVIRLWEQPTQLFLDSLGLLPLAVLSQTDDPTLVLRKVAQILEKIPDNNMQRNLTAATAVFGGLVVKPELIKTILRSELMKESAMYQEILQEGEQLGLQKGLQQAKLEMARKLFQKGMNLEEIINLTGLSEQLLQQELSQS